MSRTKKCNHPACMCQVASDTKYCSEYSKDARGTMEISGNCGHPGCSVNEREPAMTANS